MHIKTFNAQGSAAVLARIKEEFGADAVILDTREEGGQIFMTAALERGPSGNKPRERETPNASATLSAPEAARAKHASPDASATGTASRSTARTACPGATGGRRDHAGAFFSGEPCPPGNPRWQEEWNSIKGHLLALMKPALRLDRLPPRQSAALEYLQREGVEDEALLRLYARLRDGDSANILDCLSGLVAVRPWGEEHWPQRVHVLGGPFGAGKTSVAIRMALGLRLASPQLRICLVNADAGRGNGRLLLRHYCDLSALAYKEAATPLDLAAALAAAAREGYDRILVDLPGLGRDALLTALLEDAGLGDRTGEGPEDAAVHLVLPPQYSGMELESILDRYNSPHAGSLVWTRLDEAARYGQLINVGSKTGLPVSCLSFGPGLRNSLVSARAILLWRLLFRRELPGPQDAAASC